MLPHTSTSSGPFAKFGATRFCLLATFCIAAATTYLYLDTHTIQRFLLTVQENPYGTMHIFLLLYILSVVLLFPCMIVQVATGALYGFWMGLLVSWIGTSAGQCLAFLLGRYLFRPTVKTYLHNTWPTFPAIDTAIKKEGWKLVCLLRLSPVLPYNILNYALAITPVSFWVFTIASAVATVPWTALYVYLGTFSNNLMELAQGRINLGEEMHWTRRILTGVLIVVTTVYGYIVSHRAIVAVLAEQDAQAPSGGSSQSGSTAALGALATGSSSLTGSNGGHNGSFISSSVTAGKHTGSSAGALFERSRDLELGASKKSEL